MANRSILIGFVVLLLALTALSAYFAEPEKFARSGKSYSELSPQISAHSTDAAYLYDLGWSYYEAGMNNEAVQYLKQAISVKPKMAFLNFKLGEVYNAMGMKDSAVTNYQAALNIHYEYLDVWQKLIVLEPKYNANLGLLYSSKAEQYKDSDLIRNAKKYLGDYLRVYPDGEFADQCRTEITKLDLLERQAQSRANIQTQQQSEIAKQAARNAEQRTDRENFRKTKPFIAGLTFYSVGMAEDNYFFAKDTANIIDDSLSLKTYATNLNEFGLTVGYFAGSILLRGSLHYGSTSSGKNYFLKDPIEFNINDTIWDTTSTGDTIGFHHPVNTEDDVRPKVNSINTLRFSVMADYNFYYMNPILLYIGARADMGSATLNDSPYKNFENVTLTGAGLGGGLMIRYSDFLFDLSYRRDLVGTGAGGTIGLSGYYKFNL